MSVKVMSAVWSSSLPATTKVVFLALADHANDDGGSVYPSIEYVAWKCSVTRRTVQRCMKEMRASGVLTVEDYGANTPWHTITYRINVDALPQQSLPPRRTVMGGVIQSQGGVTQSPGGGVPKSPYTSVVEPSDETSKTLTTSAGNGQPRPIPAVVVRGAEEFLVSDYLITRWEASYPAINVRQELAAAFEWSCANPKNVKSNWTRFVVNWMKRAQDKAPARGTTQKANEAGTQGPKEFADLSPELKRIWGAP